MAGVAGDGAGVGLVSLVPVHDPAQHKLYSDELVSLLEDDERRKRVWNVALTGGYGSGKSSVLAGVRERLASRVVEISLSSLSDVGVQPFDRQSSELTNYIQKEIVKQLLYRERPIAVPGSRFRRISRLPVRRALVTSVLAGVLVAAVFWVTGWGDPLQLAPDAEWWQRPTILTVIGLLAAAGTFVTQVLLSNRVRIDKLGTSATSVSLTGDADGSYFDEYLDEIVYFFEMTGRDVVIIEDLDRFEDPTIYASLRELNTLLNSSGQLRKRPVHFIYAVRDSIFEDLEEARRDRNGTALDQTEDADPGVWQADAALSEPATQRTKFFELVIPIVPFITHRSSADLLSGMMREIDPDVSFDVIRVVAKHVTDMRLLRNIANEYRVFRARILAPGLLRGLTPSGLFAVVAYKNTHLQDFEQIRVGASVLDTVYRRSRRIIAAGLATLAESLAELEASQVPHTATVDRAEQLGAELQKLVERWLSRMGRPVHNASLVLAGRPWTSNEVMTVEFWEQAIDSGHPIEVRDPSDLVFTLSAATLREDLGSIVPGSWVARASGDVRLAIEKARQDQQELRRADFVDLAHPRMPLELDGEDADFAGWVKSTVGGDPLLVDLICEGLLDRNFALYASQFYGVVASANAMTYVVQHLQTESPDINYPLLPDEVPTVLTLGGEHVFESVGIFNAAIYDQLLIDDDPRLDTNLQIIAAGQSDGVAFLKAYLRQGAHPDILVRRLALHWTGIFDFLDAELTDLPEAKDALAPEAFLGADPERDYHVPDPMKATIAAARLGYPDLVDATRSPDRAVAALQRLGIRLPSLDGLSRSAQRAVVAARQYDVTAENLQVAVGDGENIALDTILDLGDPTFDHVVHFFDDYLAVLDATGRSSVTHADWIVEVMAAIERSAPGRSADVEPRMPEMLQVEDVQGVAKEVLATLSLGRRFPLTFANVTSYISDRSLDEQLIGYLRASPELDVPAEADPAQRQSLAVAIVNVTELPVEVRVRLAAQLIDTLPIGRDTSKEPELIAELLRSELISDTADTFNALSRSAAAQEAFVATSPTVSEFFLSLSVTEPLLIRLLRNPDVADEIKVAIAVNLPRNPAWQTVDIIEALGDWVQGRPFVFPADTVQVIQNAAVATSTKAAVLNASAQTLGFDAVAGYTSQLPGDYARLVARSYSLVDIPASPDFAGALTVLEGAGNGPVSSWTPETYPTRVWMRHPPADD